MDCGTPTAVMAWAAVMLELRASRVLTSLAYWAAVVCEVDELDETALITAAAAWLAALDDALLVFVDAVLDAAVEAAPDVVDVVLAEVVAAVSAVCDGAVVLVLLSCATTDSSVLASALSRSCPWLD